MTAPLKPGIAVLVLAALAVFAAADSAYPAPETLTVVVTDSGLGGLSVVADAERKLSGSGAYRQVDLVFYNALFDAGSGYNSLPDRPAKIRVFERALADMQSRYSPDVILVACNTLSVLVDDTVFADTTTVPVVGIVGTGVDLIAAAMARDDGARTLIFGTETTVGEGAHVAALAERGITGERLVVQSCPQLASYIESGYDSVESGFLIDAYVGDALAGEEEIAGPLYVSFNCTHYGYSLAAWQAAFAARGVTVDGFLDPNIRLADELLPEARRGTYPDTAVRVSAVSMVEIPAGSLESLGRYLEERSPATAAALRGYERRPNLFAWQDVAGPTAASHGDAR